MYYTFLKTLSYLFYVQVLEDAGGIRLTFNIKQPIRGLKDCEFDFYEKVGLKHSKAQGVDEIPGCVVRDLSEVISLHGYLTQYYTQGTSRSPGRSPGSFLYLRKVVLKLFPITGLLAIFRL